MNRKISIIGLSMLIFGLIIVPGFTADMNQSDSGGKTFGCGSVGEVSNVDLDDWLDEDRVSHVYFTEGPGLGMEGRKSDKEAWGKMSYTFCGEPSHFVFNGHGFSKEPAEYALVYLDTITYDDRSTEQVVGILGTAWSNSGGNVHIKGAFDGELDTVKVFLAYPDGLGDGSLDREDVVLIGDDPISYALDCIGQGVCDGNVFSAKFEAVEAVPVEPSGPVVEQLSVDDLSGMAIFFVGPYGEQIYYKLTADNLGAMISSAFIRVQKTGTPDDPILDQRLVQIYPAEMDLNLPGHDFMAIGVINADDRFNTAVLGTTDPVGSLIRGFNAGLTYATLLNEEGAMVAMGMIEEADCDALRDLWDFHFGNWDCDDDYDHCDDYDDDDCDDYDDDGCDDYYDNCQTPDVT